MSKLHILQHSLGLDQYGEGRQYRNHFVTSPGSTDYDDCVSLVSDGLMTQRNGRGNVLTGGSDLFMVTPKGIDYVALNSPQRPKLSRSKQRYLRYREYGDGFDSFLAFCRWDANPERSWNAGVNP